MPSVFKYNNNEIIDSSGIVTSSSLPSTARDRTEWYPLHNGHSYHGNYLTSNDLDEGTARSAGCAPKGFTSITEIKAYFVSGSAEPGGWDGLSYKWMIGSDNNSHQQHSRTTTINPTDSSGAFGANKIRAVDLFNINNDGNDFEDNIAENDVFGIEFVGPNVSSFFAGLGIKITWRF